MLAARNASLRPPHSIHFIHTRTSSLSRCPCFLSLPPDYRAQKRRGIKIKYIYLIVFAYLHFHPPIPLPIHPPMTMHVMSLGLLSAQPTTPYRRSTPSQAQSGKKLRRKKIDRHAIPFARM